MIKQQSPYNVFFDVAYKALNMFKCVERKGPDKHGQTDNFPPVRDGAVSNFNVFILNMSLQHNNRGKSLYEHVDQLKNVSSMVHKRFGLVQQNAAHLLRSDQEVFPKVERADPQLF